MTSFPTPSMWWDEGCVFFLVPHIDGHGLQNNNKLHWSLFLLDKKLLGDKNNVDWV